MKNLNLYIKKAFFFTLFISVFLTKASAVELVNEQFTSNINGWSVENSNVYWVAEDYNGISGGYMRHGRNDWGEKTYNFGSSYANQTLDIVVKWCATTAWERDNDFLRIRVNGSVVIEDYDGGGCQTINFTGDADSIGNFTIRFDPRTSAEDEVAYIDWFTVNGTPGNALPIANAGTDQTINLGASVTVTGSGTDSDGSIISYVWTEGATTLYSTTTNNDSFTYTPTVGTHTLTLTVTDDLGATATDTVTITVNGPPVADAGSDQSEEMSDPVTFDGSGSSDPSGQNISYLWEDASGTVLSTSVSFSKSDFPIGTHTITLTVTDDDGLTDTDDVNVTITPRTCSLTDSDSLNLTTNLVYDVERNDGTNWNVRPSSSGGPTERFFEFDITESSKAEVTLYNVDQDQARITVSRTPCPLAFEGITNTTEDITTPGKLYVKVYYVDSDDHTNIEYGLRVELTALPVAIAVNDIETTAYETPISGNVMANDSGSGIQVVSNTSPSSGSVSIQANGDFTYTPANGFSGTATFNYIIEDSSGNQSTATVSITVLPRASASATNDTFQTQINVEIRGNVLTNDTGDSISVTSNTTPTNNTFSIDSNGDFIFRPATGSSTDASFNYTITDRYGNTSTATVTISIDADTDFDEGIQDFELINPPSTRNILGNFSTLGNTVECITDASSSWTGTCQNGTAYNDNNYMARYIDIDSDTETWNSSSSNFTLPDTYDKDGGQGILWAGLFWQGSINNEDNADSTQRRAYINPSGGVKYKYINSDQNIDLETTDGNKVLLKVNNGTYENIQAHTFYYDTAHGSEGGYYAAYTDVTAFLQNKDLDANATHTVTIANITANEGRQTSTGNYAGWSMIIIYKESPLPGVKARNISVYNGYTIIRDGVGTRSVTIEGFKLPSSGDVVAQFSAFAGEGEYIYGDGSEYDRMIIDKNSDFSTSSGMPGATDQNNIFDAILANIDRDSGNNNEMTGNNNGIDIENYDVSNIMTTYRDENTNIDTVYIGMESDQDYITPSMMAFSADLYKPEICYDYTVQRNGFDITKDDREIDATTGGELSINIAIESFEGDFDLKNSQIAVNLTPTTGTLFTDAFYAPNNVNTFIPAIFIDNNTSQPLIALGQDITTSGGTIKKGQRYFSKFLYDLSSSYNGIFDVTLISTIDYGSGAVPSVQSTEHSEIPRCPQSDVYNPQAGLLNIERPDSGTYNPVTEENSRFPLYTQVVGKDFDFHMVAYDGNATPPYSAELQLSGYTFDLELINARPFNDDKAIFICNNPDSSIIKEISPGVDHLFVNFPSASATPQSRVDLSYLDVETNTALRNAAFRMWYLVDVNDTIIAHECPNAADTETCFENLYTDKIQATDTTVQADGTVGFCQTKCANGGSDCYQCLRDFHAKVICSRDNFAIRPASYRLKISDNNESTSGSSTEISLGQNDSTTSVATLAAGYKYKIDGNATSFISDSTIALGYTLDFTTPSSTDLTSTLLYDTDVGVNDVACVDKNDTDWEVHFENGSISGTAELNNLIVHSNVGEYKYHIEDHNWTIVDQSRYGIRKTFPGVDDCFTDASSVGGGSDKSGCNTSSIQAETSVTYEDMHLTYRPYKFDLSSVAFVKHPNDARNFIYLNDFDNVYYDDLTINPVDMSISFEGNVSALGKDDTLLTNFTENCAADEIILSLTRTTTPTETALLDSNGNLIELQQYLQHTSRLNAFADEQIGVDKNVTLPKASFLDTANQGKSFMLLHTTFKKPKNAVIDPFRILYEDINATAPLLTSSAHMDIHAPDGNNSYDQNITYLFAKVTPKTILYENVTINSQQTPIFVDIYCSLGSDCNTTFGLSVDSKGDDETDDTWFYATVFDNTVDGTTDLAAMLDSGVHAGQAVNPNNDISFDSDIAKQENITVSISGSVRPSLVGIDIKPVPWLLYDPLDPDGYPHYQVDFIDNSAWSGVGNTGKVVKVPSSSESATRMNW